MEVESPTEGVSKFQLVREGQAEIAFSRGREVFYNPVQEVNRDLSIAVLKLFQQVRQAERHAETRKKHDTATPATPADVTPDPPGGGPGLKVLEALAATGLRSIRYWKEIPGIEEIVVNDLDPGAVEAIRKNIEHNQLDPTKVIPHQGDAALFMHQASSEKRLFDVVDVDPYGSAAPFLDGAVRAVNEGGLLCITCTDLAVLCGNHPEACWGKYGSMPLHERYGHEMALRIVLAALDRAATLHKRYIVPVLSMQIDFYLRIFVRVYTSAKESKLSSTKLATVYQCTGCQSFWTQPLGKVTTKNGNSKFLPATLQIEGTKCGECGRNLKIGGPAWSKPLSDKDWVHKAMAHFEEPTNLYNQKDKILGLLHVVKDELDEPLFYPLDRMCNTLRVTSPPMKTFRSALLHGGYQVSNSHTNPNAVKTNAPNSVIWDIMRCWHKGNPAKNIQENSPAFQILAKEPSFQANFALHPNAVPDKYVPRFLPNPANWGPATRAGKKRSNTSSGMSGKEESKKKKT